MLEQDQYSGPLSPTAQNLEAIIALVNQMFYSAKPWGATREFPWLFSREGLKQLRIFARDSEPVSLMATQINDLRAFGCSIRVAGVGAVCTNEQDRGRGLAGSLLDDAVQIAASAGASIMLISGDRSLYRRRGAYSAGRFYKFTVPLESLAEQKGLNVAELSADDCGQALQLFQAEPIHFCHNEQQYAAKISSGVVMNQPGRTYLLRRADEPVAVLTICDTRRGSTGPKAAVSVVELAGSRSAVLAALPKVCQDFDAQTIHINAYTCDQDLLDACQVLGIQPQVVASDFTMKLLEPERLWQDFSLLLAQRIGPDELGNLHLSAQADEIKIHSLTFRLGSETFAVSGAQKVIWALFGSAELEPLADVPGRLGRTLRAALPLPLPMYGLNYI